MPPSFTRPLCLGDIMKHIGQEETRIRCLIEGEEVLNAGHLICCGLKDCSPASMTVQGLCLQTSHVKQKPHEVKCVYGIDASLQCQCSCKAGKSQRCKHIIAMLLFMNRTGLQNLEHLTCTDMERAWGKLKSKPLYEAQELKDLCHVHAQPQLQLSEQRLHDIRQRLIAAVPDSALALHFHGRFQPTAVATDAPATSKEHVMVCHMAADDRVMPYAEMLFHEAAFTDEFKLTIYRSSYINLSEAEQHFYKDYVQVSEEAAVRICTETRSQDSTKWRRERQVRITGSKCRAYFTFLPREDRSWEQKVRAMLSDCFRGNEATRYGKACEELALEEYCKVTSNVVTKLGLLVNPLVPWLGYSPDGVVFKNDCPAILIEVKSPLLGKTQKAVDIAREGKLKYLTNDGENLVVNKNHSYFSQVQLGMFLLNLDMAHFIVYSKVQSLIINVARCDHHIDELVRKLQFVYFKHLLPKLAKVA